MDNGIVGWLFIIVALVFIFGGSKKIEDMGRGLGGFMREFNKARSEALDSTPTSKPKAAKTKAKAKKKSASKKKKA